ncbi:MAG: GntR family transcriptional regulator [Thermodesulfobacteriota bacterium]
MIPREENDGLRPLRPALHAREQILTAILGGQYPPGTALPGERDLARRLGVTRPTLRETLQSLAGEGWVVIRQGKSTLVNDFWKNGGLSILSTLARYIEFLPSDFVTHLLELRLDLIPAIARRAVQKDPEAILSHLAAASTLSDDGGEFSRFDWKLQDLMAHASGNPLFPMILNDFSRLFVMLAAFYFATPRGRASSLSYYDKLARAIREKADVDEIVAETMRESIEIWESLRQQAGSGPAAQKGKKARKDSSQE